MIGDFTIEIDDDIIIDDKKYKGMHGLWILLTYTDSPREDLYIEDDFKNYSRILFDTNSMYKNNDHLLENQNLVKEINI